jgi:hypothetical protein
MTNRGKNFDSKLLLPIHTNKYYILTMLDFFIKTDTLYNSYLPTHIHASHYLIFYIKIYTKLYQIVVRTNTQQVFCKYIKYYFHNELSTDKWKFTEKDR